MTLAVVRAWRSIEPMLAVPGQPPDPAADWAFEFKYDGLRIPGTHRWEVELFSRTGNPQTSTFPEVSAALAAAVGDRELVLDGEIVALQHGRPDFAALQTRMHRTRHHRL